MRDLRWSLPSADSTGSRPVAARCRPGPAARVLPPAGPPAPAAGPSLPPPAPGAPAPPARRPPAPAAGPSLPPPAPGRRRPPAGARLRPGPPAARPPAPAAGSSPCMPAGGRAAPRPSLPLDAGPAHIACRTSRDFHSMPAWTAESGDPGAGSVTATRIRQAQPRYVPLPSVDQQSSPQAGGSPLASNRASPVFCCLCRHRAETRCPGGRALAARASAGLQSCAPAEQQRKAGRSVERHYEPRSRPALPGHWPGRAGSIPPLGRSSAEAAVSDPWSKASPGCRAGAS
jgi:hypothetical protein